MPLHQSVPLPTVQLINVEPTKYSPLISKCQIKVCYVGDEPNRNGSIITKDAAMGIAPSLRGCAIVGFYNENKGDFEGHNSVIEISGNEFKFKDTTKPYGFVDLNAQIWFQKFLDDGVEHEYLMTEGYLWTGQYPEARRVVEKGNNQSMELDSDSVKGFWSSDDNGVPEFFIINEAIISKLCILGEDVEPCFEGASISQVQFSFDDGFKEACDALVEQMHRFIEGGVPVDEKVNELEEVVEEQPVIEEEIQPEEVAPAEEAPIEEEAPVEEEAEEEVVAEEEVSEEEPVVQFNLEEVPEYIELNNKFNALTAEYEALLAVNKELTAFKASVERQQKQAMIDSFYMLSDADKKDVSENIDKYSIDEIEAKLSIICVRNKVSFDLDQDTEKKEVAPISFNLDETVSDDDLMPAWVRAVRDNVAENKI